MQSGTFLHLLREQFIWHIHTYFLVNGLQCWQNGIGERGNVKTLRLQWNKPHFGISYMHMHMHMHPVTFVRLMCSVYFGHMLLIYMIFWFLWCNCKMYTESERD